MLKIRLCRVGKKKRPSYRFIISESARDPYGKALEILGHYNPFSKVIEVNKERILYWISKGAQCSPTVHNMLVDQNVIEGDKVKASKAKKKNADSAEVSSDEKGDKVEAKSVEKEIKEDSKVEDKQVSESSKEEAKTEEKKEDVIVDESKEEVKKEENKEEAKTEEKSVEDKKEDVIKEDKT